MLASSLEQELARLPGLVEAQVEETEPLLADEPCVAATGAGDSFAAALAAAGALPGRVFAVDPLDILSYGGAERLVAHGCRLLALSVGGRTRRVVEAARIYSLRGGRVVAVTADTGSPLAEVAEEAVRMVYGGLAAGIGAARHLVMLAALAALFGEKPRLPSTRLGGGCEWLRSEMHVGAAESYASALYAVLKLYEIYGSSARYERLEQLVHAPVYSVDTVTLYAPWGGAASAIAPEAAEAMREAGLRVYTVEPVGGSPWENSLGQAHAVLQCLLEAVARDGVEKPAYRGHRGLQPLTRLIYYV